MGISGEFGWDNCPASIKTLILEIVDTYQEILGDTLVGIYLHGSLAMGCFNPNQSDIDFLAIVNEPLSVDEKKKIISYLLSIKGKAPRKGVEMSIILERYLEAFEYPTPYELHYSEDWDEKYRKGEIDLTKQKDDEDLASHAVITKNHGIRLYGKAIDDVFKEIPEEYYRLSLISDARWILDTYNDDPVYAVLNVCRILAFCSDGLITSKKEGGRWGLDTLPKSYTSLITQSLEVYKGIRDRKDMNTALLNDFIQYMKTELSLD